MFLKQFSLSIYVTFILWAPFPHFLAHLSQRLKWAFLIKRRSFDKVIFRPLKDFNENLIYCKAITFLLKIQNISPVALLSVTWHLQSYLFFYRGYCIKGKSIPIMWKLCKHVKKPVKLKQKVVEIFDKNVFISSDWLIRSSYIIYYGWQM